MYLIAVKKGELPEIYASMERNFIREELRNYEEVARLHGGGKYTLYHIEEEGVKKGFVGIWELKDFVFLEYLVVYEDFRGGGTGGRVIELIKQKYGNVLLEAELPVEPIQVRRIGFYRRHGMCVNPQTYYQPPYREGESGCRLHLLSYPALLDDFEERVKVIYREVYEREYEKK
ncbi:MAG: GNAT family N-acetyltransferase [Candidatus Coproplasma sp.]